MNIKTRLERLEAEIKPSGLLLLPSKDGESREDCIRRHGHNPLERGVTFIVYDRRLAGGL